MCKKYWHTKRRYLIMLILWIRFLNRPNILCPYLFGHPKQIIFVSAIMYYLISIYGYQFSRNIFAKFVTFTKFCAFSTKLRKTNSNFVSRNETSWPNLMFTLAALIFWSQVLPDETKIKEHNINIFIRFFFLISEKKIENIFEKNSK